ncbi:hypothetical protein FB451DRAFT_1188020 [Mycena latifolia]|nr:hypothetical protein FB451DRAFT_1188020 [Mycena latifolia]
MNTLNDRYISSAPASLHHRASKVPATPTPTTSTPADTVPSPRRPTLLPPHIEWERAIELADAQPVPYARACINQSSTGSGGRRRSGALGVRDSLLPTRRACIRAVALQTPVCEQAEPDHAVVTRVLVVGPQAVHILVSARAVSNAARARAGLDLVELRLRERAWVVLGVGSSSGTGVEAEDKDTAAADALYDCEQLGKGLWGRRMDGPAVAGVGGAALGTSPPSGEAGLGARAAVALRCARAYQHSQIGFGGGGGGGGLAAAAVRRTRLARRAEIQTGMRRRQSVLAAPRGVITARTPNYADRQDALYTYRDAGLYTNDGDGAIYTGVCVKRDHLEDWFAGELTTTDLLNSAEVKTGHAGDWNVGYKQCERGEDITIWLCMYQVDQRILAEAAIHNAYIAMGLAGCVQWTAPSARFSHASDKLVFVGRTSSSHEEHGFANHPTPALSYLRLPGSKPCTDPRKSRKWSIFSLSYLKQNAAKTRGWVVVAEKSEIRLKGEGGPDFNK